MTTAVPVARSGEAGRRRDAQKSVDALRPTLRSFETLDTIEAAALERAANGDSPDLMPLYVLALIAEVRQLRHDLMDAT